jgi:hypothetical protein
VSIFFLYYIRHYFILIRKTFFLIYFYDIILLFCLTKDFHICSSIKQGPSWSYGSWIYNYLWNQYQYCLSVIWTHVTLLVIGTCTCVPITTNVVSSNPSGNTTFCDKVCQWLVTGQWFSPGTVDSSTNKTESQYSLYNVESGIKH